MKNASNLEIMKGLLSGSISKDEKLAFDFPPPIAKLLGFELTEVGEGTASMSIETKTNQHANPMGTIHGGVLCDIADAAIGTAHVSTLLPGESFTSVDLQINFFRPVWNDKLKASAKPIHRGRSVSRYVCDIYNSKDKLVAQVTSTVMTLRGENASGR